MNKKTAVAISGLFLITVFGFFTAKAEASSQPDKPQIAEIKTSGADAARPLVSGLNPAGTEVLIYLNGVYAGLAETQSRGTPTDNFYFYFPAPLPPGENQLFAIARDKTSLLLSEASDTLFYAVRPLSAPTILAPNRESVTAKARPAIIGLTVSGTRVHVWIDGVYNGKTDYLEHPSGTANFAYHPFLNLEIGQHKIEAMAEDKQGRKSNLSAASHFNIENPLPAPIVLKPVVNKQSKTNQPFIVGLAKNDLKVRIYIDHELNGEFKVINHPSGTANFAYLPFLPLKPGSRIIYAETVDARGKVSSWSNIAYYQVPAPIISPEAAEEREKKPEAAEPEEVDVLGEEIPLSEAETPAGPEAEEIAGLIDRISNGQSAENGLIDESRKAQGRLQLNLIIFIVFVLAVIAWIFWVNRELIKERRSLAEAEEKTSAKNIRKELEKKDGKDTDKMNFL